METKPSQSDKVDEYMKHFKHPLKDVMETLRQIIMSTDKSIGEEIKWNAPAFFYTGPMKPTDQKQYTRYLIVFNVHPKGHMLLVFPSGARVDDSSGFLEGTYADGRRLLKFYSQDDIKTKKPALQRVIKNWLATL